MPVPKEKLSRSRRDRRRAHHDKLEKPSLSLCSNCGAHKLPHRVCGSCGQYRGRQVLKVGEGA